MFYTRVYDIAVQLLLCIVPSVAGGSFVQRRMQMQVIFCIVSYIQHRAVARVQQMTCLG